MSLPISRAVRCPTTRNLEALIYIFFVPILEISKNKCTCTSLYKNVLVYHCFEPQNEICENAKTLKVLRMRRFLNASKLDDIIVTYITKEVFLTTAYRVNFSLNQVAYRAVIMTEKCADCEVKLQCETDFRQHMVTFPREAFNNGHKIHFDQI